MLLENVFCRLGSSLVSGGGVGVFAVIDIAIGFNPFKYAHTDMLILPQRDFNKLPKARKQLVRDFGQKRLGYWRVPDFNNMNLAWYITADKRRSNLILNSSDGNFYTKRQVFAGEELFADYVIYS